MFKANVAFNHGDLIKSPKIQVCGSALTLGKKTMAQFLSFWHQVLYRANDAFNNCYLIKSPEMQVRREELTLDKKDNCTNKVIDTKFCVEQMLLLTIVI